MTGEQRGQDVPSVEQHAPHPGEVIQTDLVDEDALRLDPEHVCEVALEADRDVAQADRTMSRVEQRASDDADRIREVDDPRVAARQLADAVGDLQHDGNGSHRLREAARPGRLLADAAASERDRLVAEPRRLPADADLNEHEVRVLDGAVEVRRERQLPAPAGPVEHARSEPADDVEPLVVDVINASSSTSTALSPDTSSGVYVEPAPTTATFIPLPPSTSRPRRTPSARGRR